MLSSFSDSKQKEKNKSIQEVQFVVFLLGEKEYGVKIEQTREIIAEENYELTPVPNSPEYVNGIINLRGDIVPIVNLFEKLNIEINKKEINNKIITIEINGSLIGMEVDEVKEIERFKKDEISEPPAITKNINRDFVNGVGKTDEGLLIILDLNKVLSDREMEEIDQMDI